MWSSVTHGSSMRAPRSYTGKWSQRRPLRARRPSGSQFAPLEDARGARSSMLPRVSSCRMFRRHTPEVPVHRMFRQHPSEVLVAHSRSSRPSGRNSRRSRPGSKTLTRLLGRSPRQGRPFSSSCLNMSTRRPLKPSGHHSSQGRLQGEATMPREKSRSFLPSRSAPPLRWYNSSHQKFKRQWHHGVSRQQCHPPHLT